MSCIALLHVMWYSASQLRVPMQSECSAFHYSRFAIVVVCTRLCTISIKCCEMAIDIASVSALVCMFGQILFLNKQDLFRNKVLNLGHHLKIYFPQYEGIHYYNIMHVCLYEYILLHTCMYCNILLFHQVHFACN